MVPTCVPSKEALGTLMSPALCVRALKEGRGFGTVHPDTARRGERAPPLSTSGSPKQPVAQWTMSVYHRDENSEGGRVLPPTSPMFTAWQLLLGSGQPHFRVGRQAGGWGGVQVTVPLRVGGADAHLAPLLPTHLPTSDGWSKERHGVPCR